MIIKPFTLLGKSLKITFKDKVNLLLTLLPATAALILYVVLFIFTYNKSEALLDYVQGYLPSFISVGFIGNFFFGVLLVTFLILMNWTFVLLAGLIAAPFNSFISERVAKSLEAPLLEPDKKRWAQFLREFFGMIFTEVKKVLFLLLISLLVFVLNFFPVLAPLSIALMALLMAAQFIDYSWSREELKFLECVKDLLKNIIPYSLHGLLFIGLAMVPVLNALLPAIATTHFTLLWLDKKTKK